MSKIQFIAEISSNHNCDLNRCKKFIKSAHEIGCTGVKFQLFKIEELFAPEILRVSKKHSIRKSWELPLEYIPILSDLAHSLDLSFSCSPFYLKAVDELEPYVDFYKIASYEILWLDLFEKCGNTSKPIVFSTGMATINEIESVLNCLINTKTNNITVLHCNSVYPTPVNDANLAVIKELLDVADIYNNQNQAQINVGYSDHTVSSAVIYRAIHQYNINFVEFHLDLDGKGEEYQSGHCWLPCQISEVISTAISGYTADGEKIIGPSQSELPDRDWRADPSDGLRPLLTVRESFND